MIKKLGKPITGGPRQFRPTPNVLSNAADTSRDAQKLVRASASPFQNRQGPVHVRAGRVDMSRLGIPYAQASPVGKQGRVNLGRALQAGTTAGMMAAVGYGPRATMSNSSIISGHPTKNASRTVGEGNFPKARGRRG